jgi:hypothetical protein
MVEKFTKPKEKIIFDISEIKREFQAENYREVIRMLVDQRVRYFRNQNGIRKTYEISITRDPEEDNDFAWALSITARDERGREAQGYRYPTSVDSLFDSCVDIVNLIRGSQHDTRLL